MPAGERYELRRNTMPGQGRQKIPRLAGWHEVVPVAVHDQHRRAGVAHGRKGRDGLQLLGGRGRSAEQTRVHIPSAAAQGRKVHDAELIHHGGDLGSAAGHARRAA